MKRRIRFLFLITLIWLSPLLVMAGTTHVRGYTKKDGTYVAPHVRTTPDSSKLNNFSTKGNVNPYTGQPGTKTPSFSTAPSSKPLPDAPKSYNFGNQVTPNPSSKPETTAPNLSGDTKVSGFTKKDGTYVAPHFRSSPDTSKLNNYSTKGNVNPYTGKQGTIDPYKK